MNFNYIDFNLTKKADNTGFKMPFEKIAKGISGVLKSILSKIADNKICPSEKEKNKLNCRNQCLLIDKKITELKSQYKELNNIFENEMDDTERNSYMTHYLRQKLFKIMLLIERLADYAYYEIIKNDDSDNGDWFIIMDKIKTLHYCI